MPARPTEFEWDDRKAESNLGKHGISFDEALAIFAAEEVIVLDVSRAQDGEAREKIIGPIERLLFSVVYTMRGEVCRLISARRANGFEREVYDDHYSPPA